ncbi:MULTISPECIES: pyridoxine/pyridoxamine 5'-phosphate oxidase [unclassified Streptomyces]|uniref:pyridoxine/pyridoxamine 5'-phosphate oxidase n=1 Tax=unclassified Streptomyces TaxID=2593676 RepID=UPI001314A265|nr:MULTISPECIES: pyridoxal 5'-phosphate synthase [unclassified Streptomyces]
MSEKTRNKFRALRVFADLEPSGFTIEDLRANPLQALEEWILSAAEAGQVEPHAMTLCTVGADGTPSSRVLLCKDIDDERLYFATHADSRKGQEIARNPRVAVQFHWPKVGRQLRIVGGAEAAGRSAGERDFAERGRGSRLSAHLRKPTPPADRDEVLAEYTRLAAAYPDEVPCSPSWTLYGIRPDEIEFWEASPDRIHTRVSFRREEGGWQTEYLWP